MMTLPFTVNLGRILFSVSCLQSPFSLNRPECQQTWMFESSTDSPQRATSESFNNHFSLIIRDIITFKEICEFIFSYFWFHRISNIFCDCQDGFGKTSVLAFGGLFSKSQRTQRGRGRIEADGNPTSVSHCTFGSSFALYYSQTRL